MLSTSREISTSDLRLVISRFDGEWDGMLLLSEVSSNWEADFLFGFRLLRNF